jgi:hypothetical protein
MDFHTYLTKHDGKPRPDGAELIRLAAACERSSYYLYLTALGHKRVGSKVADCLAANSIGGELDATRVNVRRKVDNKNAQTLEVERAQEQRERRG